MDSQQLFQPSWPFYNIINSNLDQAGFMNTSEFSSSFSSPEEASHISSIPCFSTMFPSEFDQSLASADDLDLDHDHWQALLSVEDLLIGGDMEFTYEKLSESEGSFHPSSNGGKDGWSPTPSIKSNGESAISPSSQNLPGEEMEIDTQLSVLHLLKACGEAMENGQIELADVIMRRVSEKVSLVGEPILRLAFNLSQDFEKQHGDYLKQESFKNFEAAFRAFYQIFPYGRFAHFASNSAILEAMPADAGMLHIVDFDMGEGVQWPPMLEAMAKLNKNVKLTAIKWETDDCNQAPMWSFEEAKRRLIDHARCFGLKLQVEERAIEELVNETKRAKKRGGNEEWLAFNCMVGLPHMGKVRNRKLVEEFICIANELIANNKGILTFGDGDNWETLKNCSSFGSFFEGNITHYQGILESMEYSFPIHLAEARMAMESLFVAPYVSSQDWLRRWMEMKVCKSLQIGTQLEGCRVSRESLEEAREMVKGKHSLYEVTIGGQGDSEMILEWRGNLLVRVSAWKN